MLCGIIILISFVTSSFLAAEVATTVFVCRHNTSSSEEFKCQNGTSCILNEHVCNGVRDCPDGSDELVCPNHTEESDIRLRLNRSRRQLSCGDNLWQCQDGHCIPTYKVCNGEADCYDSSDEAFSLCNSSPAEKSRLCVLPPYPEHGTYTVGNVPDARPGQTYPSFSLTVVCQRGYGVVEPFDDGGGTDQVYCINGEWFQDIPKCVRFCKLDPDPSIRYMCLSRRGVELCKKYLPPGTSVEPICNSPIYYSTESFSNMKCISGFWDYVALCKAECGRITPGGKQLVIGGTLAKRGELPWHAGIYRKTSEPYLQICGASLVSNNVVISAAHCFWKDTRKHLPASEFGVAIGKLYRTWDSDRDNGVQKSDVKEIKIPSLFEGEAANFQEDIAVLILTTPFNYTTYIRPVCLNFNIIFDNLQLQHGKLGRVAGWGLTATNGEASQTLKVIDMPFINVGTCISTLPSSFREYITGDKFCAGYTNGSALCQGDSGGGLAFSDKELGIDRYYLRGVVSAAPNADDKLCNDNTYTTFTKITKHQEFIKEALAASARKICPLYSFQCADGSCVDSGSECNGKLDCADGSDESDEYCLVGDARISFQQPPQHSNFEKPVTRPPRFPIPNQVQQSYSPQAQVIPVPRPLNRYGQIQPTSQSNNECGVIAGGNDNLSSFYNGRPFKRGDIPWLVAIFRLSESSVKFTCGGTLISNRHVITVAHVVYRRSGISSIKSFMVKLGGYNLNDWADDIVVSRSLVSASVIDSFNSSILANDISILTLNNRVEFNMHIRPACLWDGDTELSRIVGDVGMFGGWGEQRHKKLPIGEPHVLRLPIVSTEVCRASNEIFHRVTSDKTLCAGYRNMSNPCVGDSGGGLYLLDGGKWRLRGILSLSLQSEAENETCDHNEFVVFTDVAQYLPWLKKVISETYYD